MKKFLLSMALACFGLTFSSSAQTVLTQNFEGGIAPWTNTITGGGTGWLIASVATTTQLGTIPAHTKYAVVDESVSSGYNNPALLTSPSFSLVGVTAPYLAFDYYYFQAYLNSAPYPHEGAWIQISTDGGTTYSLLDSIPAITTAGGPWATAFVSLASITPTATCKLQFCYIDRGAHIIGVAIDNILVYGASATDIGLASVAPLAGSAADYFLSGSAASFTGVVTNFNSTTAISSFTVNYQVGTSAVVTSTITSSVAPLSTAAFTAPTPYSVAIGQYPVKIWVTTTGDANLSNDSLSTVIVGAGFMPKKRILFEEGTGSWCGYCVRGIVFMDSLWKLHSNDVSIISVHDHNTYDPMAIENATTTQYDAFISSKIPGYPDMVIDRRYDDDPSNALVDYGTDNTIFGFANMGVTATTTGGVVNATVKVQPAITLTGDYELAVVVEEDTVTGTAAGYAQHDYYGIGGMAASTPLYGCGYNFNDSAQVIPAGSIKFPFVARWTAPADFVATPNGITGSLPATMTYGVLYTYNAAAIDIPADWNAAHLRVVAMLIDNNTANATYGTVLNSVNTSSSPFVLYRVGVPSVTAGVENMTVYPNPAQNDAHVRFELQEAQNVQFSVYDMVGRKVFSVPAEQMNAGGQQINFSTANLASGIYNVVLHTDSGNQSQRLSIVK